MSNPLEIFLILILVTFVGGLAQGVSGIGFGLIVVGILDVVLNVEQTTLIILAIGSILSAWIVIKYREYIDWRGLILILFAGIPGTLFAVVVVSRWGSTYFLKIFLGILLMSMGVFSFILNNRRVPVRTNSFLDIIVGILGGFIGGAFAISGPIFAIYFLWKFEDRKRYNVSLQVVFLIYNLFALLLFGMKGFIYPSTLTAIGAGMIGALAGLTIGLKLFEKINLFFVRHMVYGLIVLSGGWLVVFNGFLFLRK